MSKPLKVPQVAELLGICQWLVRDLARKGAIKADKPGRDWLFSETAVLNYKKRNS